MKHERRRYFRINETLGVSYEVVNLPRDSAGAEAKKSASILDMVSEQDARLHVLLEDVAQKNPQVAELVAVLNQKLDRLASQLAADNQTVDRIAQRVKEANISACGIAFVNDEAIPVGAALRLELSLFPGDLKLNVNGRVVGCDASTDEAGWYWRIDFYGLNEKKQEQLIQHIVKRQSAQLKRMRPG